MKAQKWAEELLKKAVIYKIKELKYKNVVPPLYTPLDTSQYNRITNNSLTQEEIRLEFEKNKKSFDQFQEITKDVVIRNLPIFNDKDISNLPDEDIEKDLETNSVSFEDLSEEMDL